jgi:hypothetical protein
VIFGNVVSVEKEFLGVYHENTLATRRLDGVVDDSGVNRVFSTKSDVGFEVV